MSILGDMATSTLPARPSTRMYKPPEGTYDQPFTWIFDGGPNGANLTNGQNALNQFVYIKVGYGDFICRRIVGLASVLNPTSGKFQIYDKNIRPIQSDPTYVTAMDTDDQMMIRELEYPETNAIRFDLYDVELDPPGYNFPAFELVTTISGNTGYGGSGIGSLGGPGGTLDGVAINNFILMSQPNPANNGAVGGSVLAAVQQAGGPGWDQYTTVYPTPPYTGDNAGLPVSMNQDTAVYGAAASPPSGGSAYEGAAFVMTRDNLANWTQVQALEGSDSTAGDNFGSGVAIDQASAGTTIAVGAVSATSSKGAVYVFNYSAGSWSEVQKLQPVDLAAGDVFGAPLWLYGQFLFVAAQGQNSGAGAVYIFQLSGGTWTQIQKISGVAGGVLGFSLCFDGTTLAIGQVGANNVLIYTYNGSTFALQQTLTGSDTANGDNFGSAVSVATTYGLLAIGAYRWPGGAGPGKAYLFKHSTGTWIEAQDITPPDATPGQNYYGLAVTVGAYVAGGNATGWLVIGAPGWGNGGTGFSGPGHIYFMSATAPDPVTKIIQAQIAFQGVRRQKGPPPQIAPTCPFDPRAYSYTQTITIDAAGPATTPTASIYQTINDYDFELDEIIITYSSGATLPRVVTMVQLFDAVKNVTSNIPMLDVYMNGAPASPYVNGAQVPPLLYPQQTQIRLDVYSMVASAYLPVTMQVEFKGRQRYPCANC